MTEILKEAKRLYDLGWAVHWIRPKSKAPVESGWSAPTRDAWPVLRGKYQKGYGLGVKMGAASKVDGGFLANIDVDLKSSKGRHRAEALGLVDRLFPGLVDVAPYVVTGYGMRYFVRTRLPVKSGKLGASGEETKVLLPTTPINQRQRNAVREGKLTEEEILAGYRIRPAWEVEFMSEGRQVVLPPSIHPETGNRYYWGQEILARLPRVSIKGMEGMGVERRTTGERGRPLGSTTIQNFKPLDTDGVLAKVPAAVARLVRDGDPEESDRSASLFTAALRMVKAGLEEREILSVLTDPDTFLGAVAYEHRQTRHRSSAAAWVRDYTLKKARDTVSADRVFRAEVGVTPLRRERTKKERRKAKKEGENEDGGNGGSTGGTWKDSIERSGQHGEGPPKPTLQNTVLILTHAVGARIFERDTFRMRDSYGIATPWGGRAGGLITDDEIVQTKLWLAQHWRVEPNVGTIFEAVTAIALENGFHSVQRELEALPEWDGVERLDSWLKDHFGAEGDEEYLAQVFRKWLVASVTRAYEAGAKFDWMPIFEGDQGVGKSTFGSTLFGEDFFTDWLPPLHDKDAALGLQGIRCHEFGELEGLRRNEIETIKAFVTRRVDKVRPPYGRKTLEVPRQVVFFGTTNKEHYLQDDTGNRRFNPIEVGQLDFETLVAERDQLWAEGLWIYRNRLERTLYLEGVAKTFAVKMQESKKVMDETIFMLPALKKFLKDKDSWGDFNPEKFKLHELWGDGRPFEKCREDMKTIKLAAKAIKLAGGTNRFIRGIKWWKMP